MSTQKHKSKSGPCEAPAMPLKDHKLAGVNPTKQQFEPTPAQPIRRRARMAGY